MAAIARRLGKRMVQLENAASMFETDKQYTESQVNLMLMAEFDDHVFARRLLIEWGFLDSSTDGSRYWLVRTTRLASMPNLVAS